MKPHKLFVISAIMLLYSLNTNAQSWVIGGNTVTRDTTLGTRNNFALQVITNHIERMRITAAGSVGIGTTQPASLFSVVKAAGGPATADFRNLGIGPNVSWIHFGSLGDWYIRSAANNGNIIIQDQSATGKVGIGTTTPFRKLEVNDGDIRIKTTSATRYLEFVNNALNHVDYRFKHENQFIGSEFQYSSLTVQSSNSNFSKGIVDLASFSAPEHSQYAFIVHGKARASAWELSDVKLKKDINSFDNALDIVKKLKPKIYFFKREEFAALNLPKEKQYGFLAQEIEKVLPELVTTSKEQVNADAQGKSMMEELKAIKYSELIPILTKAIQEQQAQIEELKTEVDRLSDLYVKGITNTETTKSPAVYLNIASLSQNIPNPFNNTTTIQYTLPSEKVAAYIIITDKSGKTIKQINVSGSGKGSITIDASTLSSGAYNYSLYVSGKLVGTKQMVLTK